MFQIPTSSGKISFLDISGKRHLPVLAKGSSIFSYNKGVEWCNELYSICLHQCKRICPLNNKGNKSCCFNVNGQQSVSIDTYTCLVLLHVRPLFCYILSACSRFRWVVLRTKILIPWAHVLFVSPLKTIKQSNGHVQFCYLIGIKTMGYRRGPVLGGSKSDDL